MRTEVLLYGDAAVLPDVGGNTLRKVADYEGTGLGAIKFGTSCASDVTIIIGSDGAEILGNWAIYLNDAVAFSGTIEDVPEELVETRIIEMTPSPCGNVIYVEAKITSGSDGNAISVSIGNFDSDPVFSNTFTFYDFYNSQYQPLI
jgi:hypothetical protein